MVWKERYLLSCAVAFLARVCVSNSAASTVMDLSTNRILVSAEVWDILSRCANMSVLEKKFNEWAAEESPEKPKLATADDFRRYAVDRKQHDHKMLFEQVMKACRQAIKADPASTCHVIEGTLPVEVMSWFQEAGFVVTAVTVRDSHGTQPGTQISWS